MDRHEIGNFSPPPPSGGIVLEPTPVRVLRRRRETADTVTLELDASAFAGAEFAPGRFNMLYAFGVGEAPLSLSGGVDRPQRLTHTVRAVGAVTTALSKLRGGSVVGLRGPYGVGWPMSQLAGRDVLVVAGGLGLAPLRPVIEALALDPMRASRLDLLIGARTPHDLLFTREWRRWDASPHCRVLATVDRATPDWRRHVGVVPALIDLVEPSPGRTTALVCGPEVMIRFTVRKLLAKGLRPADVWVSLERNMRCAVGLCGHCQLGPAFVCKDGPVFRYDRVAWLIERREM